MSYFTLNLAKRVMGNFKIFQYVKLLLKNKRRSASRNEKSSFRWCLGSRTNWCGWSQTRLVTLKIAEITTDVLLWCGVRVATVHGTDITKVSSGRANACTTLVAESTHVGASKTDLFYERKKYGFKKRWAENLNIPRWNCCKRIRNKEGKRALLALQKLF